MRNTTTRSTALIIRETKDAVAPLCLMDRWSGCGKRKGDDPKDQWKRGDCDCDYQILAKLVADELVTWDECEAAGMCLPRKRQTQKRVLATIVTRRSV